MLLSQGSRCAPTAGLKLAHAFGVKIETEPVPQISNESLDETHLLDTRDRRDANVTSHNRRTKQQSLCPRLGNVSRGARLTVLIEIGGSDSAHAERAVKKTRVQVAVFARATSGSPTSSSKSVR